MRLSTAISLAGSGPAEKAIELFARYGAYTLDMRTIGLPELLVIMSAVTLLALLVGVVIWAVVHRKPV